MRSAGRADVTGRFVAGLNDDQQDVRLVSAWGLKMAPSSKHEEAATALFDRFGKESDSSVTHAILDSLTAVATPAHSDRVRELLPLLERDQPMESGLLLEWKTKAARTVIRVLGPEEAIALFSTLDASDPGERLGLEAAVTALTMYGEFFPDMDPERLDELRDQFRVFGIGLLRQETPEEVQRDAGVRSAVVSMLFPLILDRKRDWREVEVTEIRSAVEAALPKEQEGSPTARQMRGILERLERAEFESDKAR